MMNYKFLILSILLASVLFGSEYESKKITKDEFQNLKAIDKNIYNLAAKRKVYDTKRVASFIYLHLAYDLDFTRLKINSSLNLKHNSSDATFNENETTVDRNSYIASINLSYPLFDKKELNDRKKQIIVLKQKIISEVQKYFKLKAKLHDLELELKILTQLETRAKARKLDGVGGFKDWLDVVREIKKTHYDISIVDLELNEKMQTLISYVLSSKQQSLKEIL